MPKISQLPAATAINRNTDELVPVVQSGITKYVPLSQISNGFGLVNVRAFGAIGDGTLHLLSERFSTLAAAQAVYPHVTSLSQSIDWAAFQAAHNSMSPLSGTLNNGINGTGIGKTIYIPPGYYRMGSDTWQIYKRCTIEGDSPGQQPYTAAARLQWEPGVDAIFCYSFSNSPTVNLGAADYSTIRNLNISTTASSTPLNGTVNGCGIHSTVALRVYNCNITLFGQHGIWIDSSTGASHIADGWYIEGCITNNNGGDGLHITQSDANVGCAVACISNANNGWGYYDNPAFGNCYISCQCAAPVGSLGAFHSVTATFFGSSFVNCYIEAAGNPLLDLDSNGMWYGGVSPLSQTGTGVGNFLKATASAPVTINTQSRIAFQHQGTVFFLFDLDQQLKNLVGMVISSVAGTDSIATTGSKGFLHTSSITGASIMSRYTNPNGVVGSIQIGGTTTTYATTSDYRLKGNVAPMTISYDLSKIDGMADHWKRLLSARPVTFTWNVDGTPGKGFIAHELQAFYPEAVTGVKDGTREEDIEEDVPAYTADELAQMPPEARSQCEGVSFKQVVGTRTVPDYQQVDTSFIVADLVAAIQDLRRENDDLKARLAVLEAKT